MFRKRFIALVMALTMLFTLMAPAFTFALDDGETPDQTPASDAAGDTNEQPPAADPDENVDETQGEDDLDKGGDDQIPGDGDGDGEGEKEPLREAPANRSTLADGWYLVGDMNGWTPSTAYYFGSADINSVYTLANVSIQANEGFKAVYVYNDELQSGSYRPAGGSDTNVTTGKAGTFTVYFKDGDFLRATTLENGFYILGLAGWNISDLTADYKLNGPVDGMYTKEITLSAASEFKIKEVSYGGFTNEWYPGDGYANVTIGAGKSLVKFDGSNVTVKPYYTITWEDAEGNQIDTTEVLAGDSPEHSDPKKAGYHFAGWDPERTLATGNTSYTATFHQLTEHPAKEATCTEPGNKAYWSCAKCNTTYKDAYGMEGAVSNDDIEIPALDHDYVAVVTAPTCVEGGYTTYTCSRCGDSYTDDETPATGIHVWGEPVWGVPQDGDPSWTVIVTRTCSTCSTTETKTSYVDNADVATVAATCTTGGYKEATFAADFNDEHFKKTITWDSTGPEDSAHPTPLEAHAAVLATCTEAGNSAYWYCPTCGKYFSDAEGNHTIAENSLVIPATGVHTYENGVCTGCGAVAVAKIGDSLYASLADAVAAAQGGDTIVLLKDVELDEGKTISGESNKYGAYITKSITLDGNNHTITSTVGRAIGVKGVDENVSVTFKNLIVKNSAADAICIITRGGIDNLVLDNVTLDTTGCHSGYNQPLTIGGSQSTTAEITIRNNCVIKTNDQATNYYAIIIWHKVNMTIDDSTIMGWACVYVKPDAAGSNVTINNCKLFSKGLAGSSNHFAMLMSEAENVKIAVTNSEINVTAADNTYQGIGCPSQKTGTEISLGNGNNVTLTGETAIVGFNFSNDGTDKVEVSGGTFNEDVYDYCADGYICVKDGDKYIVKAGKFVAEVEGERYETFAAAVTAANGEKTITLLADIAEAYTLTVGETLKVEHDNKTLTVNAPEGSVLKTSKADGVTTYTLAEAVATVTHGETVIGYASLEAAVAAAVDGDTITVLKDCSGNGIKALQGKFNAAGLTIDFDGHTYTMDGAMVGSTGTQTQAFQLLKDNKITFKNGTLYSEKAKMLVQNYSDLTLDRMTLTLNNASYASAYTLSNNNGNVVIKDTTINANPAGGVAFDVCRYASYPSVSVTVTGSSTITGDIEVSASGSDAKDGFSLLLDGGTFSGAIVVDATAAAAMAATPDKATVKKSETVNITIPEDYKWVETETEGQVRDAGCCLCGCSGRRHHHRAGQLRRQRYQRSRGQVQHERPHGGLRRQNLHCGSGSSGRFHRHPVPGVPAFEGQQDHLQEWYHLF